jgi:hypothetical protein
MTYKYPYVLGVDPDSEHDGICLLDPAGHVVMLAVLPHGKGDLRALINAIRRTLDGARAIIEAGTLVMGIEGQFLGKNPRSMVQLIEVRRTWEVMATIRDITTICLEPATWRSLAFPGIDPIGTKRAQWKALAQERLQRDELGRPFQGGAVKFDADAADAYCIAHAARMKWRGARA